MNYTCKQVMSSPFNNNNTPTSQIILHPFIITNDIPDVTYFERMLNIFFSTTGS